MQESGQLVTTMINNGTLSKHPKPDRLLTALQALLGSDEPSLPNDESTPLILNALLGDEKSDTNITSTKSVTESSLIDNFLIKGTNIDLVACATLSANHEFVTKLLSRIENSLEKDQLGFSPLKIYSGNYSLLHLAALIDDKNLIADFIQMGLKATHDVMALAIKHKSQGAIVALLNNDAYSLKPEQISPLFKTAFSDLCNSVQAHPPAAQEKEYFMWLLDNPLKSTSASKSIRSLISNSTIPVKSKNAILEKLSKSPLTSVKSTSQTLTTTTSETTMKTNLGELNTSPQNTATTAENEAPQDDSLNPSTETTTAELLANLDQLNDPNAESNSSPMPEERPPVEKALKTEATATTPANKTAKVTPKKPQSTKQEKLLALAQNAGKNPESQQDSTSASTDVEAQPQQPAPKEKKSIPPSTRSKLLKKKTMKSKSASEHVAPAEEPTQASATTDGQEMETVVIKPLGNWTSFLDTTTASSQEPKQDSSTVLMLEDGPVALPRKEELEILEKELIAATVSLLKTDIGNSSQEMQKLIKESFATSINLASDENGKEIEQHLRQQLRLLKEAAQETIKPSVTTQARATFAYIIGGNPYSRVYQRVMIKPNMQAELQPLEDPDYKNSRFCQLNIIEDGQQTGSFYPVIQRTKGISNNAVAEHLELVTTVENFLQKPTYLSQLVDFGSNKTVLHWGAMTGNLDMLACQLHSLSKLRNNRSDRAPTINTPDALGNTFLHVAAMKGDFFSTEFYNQTADSRPKSKTFDPLPQAEQNRRRANPLNIAGALSTEQDPYLFATPQTMKKDNNKFFELLNKEVTTGLNFRNRNHQKELPIHLAVRYNHPEFVDGIIRNTANTHPSDITGHRNIDAELKNVSILHLAASSFDEKTNTFDVDMATLQAIAQRKDIDLNQQDEDGNTPLHYAAAIGNVPAILLLVKLGAANMENANGDTPLAVALSLKLDNFNSASQSRTLRISNQVRGVTTMLARKGIVEKKLVRPITADEIDKLVSFYDSLKAGAQSAQENLVAFSSDDDVLQANAHTTDTSITANDERIFKYVLNSGKVDPLENAPNHIASNLGQRMLNYILAPIALIHETAGVVSEREKTAARKNTPAQAELSYNVTLKELRSTVWASDLTQNARKQQKHGYASYAGYYAAITTADDDAEKVVIQPQLLRPTFEIAKQGFTQLLESYVAVVTEDESRGGIWATDKDGHVLRSTKKDSDRPFGHKIENAFSLGQIGNWISHPRRHYRQEVIDALKELEFLDTKEECINLCYELLDKIHQHLIHNTNKADTVKSSILARISFALRMFENAITSKPTPKEEVQLDTSEDDGLDDATSDTTGKGKEETVSTTPRGASSLIDASSDEDTNAEPKNRTSAPTSPRGTQGFFAPAVSGTELAEISGEEDIALTGTTEQTSPSTK